ncbi:MAG: DoxX family protein [Saprospiraceae bacterium]|nr:DoxX family protein [Saprospiraceae bacterium]
MDLIFSNLPAIFVTAFFAILFLQSGLDKVLDYKGNLAYLSDHFKNSPLGGSINLLLPILTLLEVMTGLVSIIALLQLLFSGQSVLAYYSPLFAGISLLCLFFGQRIARDYGGAAGIVPYFIVVLLGLWMIKM